MFSPPIYLNSENIEDLEDRWAFTVYNTLRNPHESIVVKEKEIDVLHSCLTLKFQDYPVIARKEYELIWQHALTAHAKKDGCGGLVVYGQPGIGKSLFLLYALAHAIQARITVAWCAEPDIYYLFESNGVSRRAYNLIRPPDILALFDTVPGLASPKRPFVGFTNDSFVVHATSTLSRWEGWSWQANADVWVMDVWNPTEIEYIRKLKPKKPGFYDPVEVSTYLGPNACSCANFWKNTGNPTNDFNQDPPEFESCAILFRLLKNYSSEEMPYQREHLYTFFFAVPHLTFQRPIYVGQKLRITYVFPTKFLRNLMFEPYCSLSNMELGELLRKFHLFPEICGAMYEVFALQKQWMFQEDGMCYFSDTAPFALPGNLVPTYDMLSADTPPNTFWVAPADYPTIDAVSVTSSEGKKCFTILQMAIAQKHEIQDIGPGIQKIWANFEELDDVDWRFVYVVSSEEIGKALWWKEPLYVCAEQTHGSSRPGRPKEQSVSVGYMVVNLPGLQDLLASIYHQM